MKLSKVTPKDKSLKAARKFARRDAALLNRLSSVSAESELNALTENDQRSTK